VIWQYWQVASCTQFELQEMNLKQLSHSTPPFCKRAGLGAGHHKFRKTYRADLQHFFSCL